MTVLFNFLAVTVGFYNLLYMLRAEFVLGLDLFKLFAGINEQDIIVFLTAFLQYENTGRNTCTIEYIGWQTDNSIDIVFLLYQEAAYNTLCIPSKQNSVRSNASHRTTFIEVMNHMQNKSIVGCFLRCKSSCFTETVVVVEFVGSTPFGRERRICNHCIELHIIECVPFKRIAILYFEAAESDTVQQHIHSGKVVSSRIFLLSIDICRLTDTCCTEQ